MGDLQTDGGSGTATPGGRLGRGVGLSRPGRDRHGWVTSRPAGIGHGKAWRQAGVVLSFAAWPTRWVSALVWVVLWLYRSGQREKREKFSEEMRGERKNPEEISVCFGGVRADKKWFFNFYKVYSNLSKMKGYCSLCKKI